MCIKYSTKNEYCLVDNTQMIIITSYKLYNARYHRMLGSRVDNHVYLCLVSRQRRTVIIEWQFNAIDAIVIINGIIVPIAFSGAYTNNHKINISHLIISYCAYSNWGSTIRYIDNKYRVNMRCMFRIIHRRLSLLC